MFWKLLIGPLAIIITFVVMSFLFFFPWMEEHLLQNQAIQLKAFARQIEPFALVSLKDGSMTSNVRPIGQASFEWKIFNADGKELGQSVANSSTPTEVTQALTGTEVHSLKRLSNSEPRSQMIAIPLMQESKIAGVILVSDSTSQMDQFVRRTRGILISGLGLSLLISVLIAATLSSRWSRRLANLRQSVALLTTPVHSTSVPHPEIMGEFGDLSRTLDQVRVELSRQIRGIDQVRRDLQSMLETIPEAVIAIDAEQRVLFANASTYRLFGLPPHDISGQKLWEILRQPGLQDAVSLTFASKEQTSTEFEIRTPPRVLSFRGRSLTVGSGHGIIIVLHDITELRRLERLRQDFFASVSHELKTPLAAIKAYTETLLDADLEKGGIVERFLQRIEEQADRLHVLVIDMLMLARVESEDHGFDIRPIDAKSVVASSIDLFREKAQAKGIEVSVHLADDSGTVLADVEGLGMIVRNLVDNAIKYTGTGGRVNISMRRDANLLVMEVADTGGGIPPEDLTRIFERFYRVDKARSRELGGTGLGLSIVKHLVQRFAGTVSVRSRLNEGSVFTVSLPRAADSAPGSVLHRFEQEVTTS